MVILLRSNSLGGLWNIEPLWFQANLPLYRTALTEQQESKPLDSRFRVGNIALIPISGPITKYDSFFSFFFGGVSTTRIKELLTNALQDSSIQSIMFLIDSPGGQVAGITALADMIFASRGIKPIAAYIEDMGASAAFHLASQADRVVANGSAEIGSVGTMAVVEDSSEMAAKEGKTVHVVTSKGAEDHKGAGVPGVKVTPIHLEDLQERVDNANGFFLKAIGRGRGMTAAEVRGVATGQLYGATQAQTLGLIDDIMSIEQALLVQARLDEGARRRERIMDRSEKRRSLA